MELVDLDGAIHDQTLSGFMKWLVGNKHMTTASEVVWLQGEILLLFLS